MKKYDLQRHFCALFLFVFFATSSCKGQPKTAYSDEKAAVPKKGLPKMVRTQSTEYSQVSSGYQDKAGNLWFGTVNEGVYRYDGTYFTQFTTKDGLPDNGISGITEDKNGHMLFGTRGGIYRYDGDSITALTSNNDASKKSITSLLADKDGNLWFGTFHSGVFRYDGKTFANFLNKDAVPSFIDGFNIPEQPFNLGERNQFILDILEDKNGHIWLSSWNGGGAWRYDGRSFTNYLPSAAYYLFNEDERHGARVEVAPAVYVHAEEFISDDMIFSMSEDKAGNIWFATRRHGACRYDGKKFSVFPEQLGIYNKGMYSILQVENGDIWFTTERDGVWRYDGNTFKNFTTADGLVNNSVWFVLEDKNGNLWFGTRYFGLSCYNGETFSTFSE